MHLLQPWLLDRQRGLRREPLPLMTIVPAGQSLSQFPQALHRSSAAYIAARPNRPDDISRLDPGMEYPPRFGVRRELLRESSGLSISGVRHAPRVCPACRSDDLGPLERI
jgi:hypothetical protein